MLSRENADLTKDRAAGLKKIREAGLKLGFDAKTVDEILSSYSSDDNDHEAFKVNGKLHEFRFEKGLVKSLTIDGQQIRDLEDVQKAYYKYNNLIREMDSLGADFLKFERKHRPDKDLIDELLK